MLDLEFMDKNSKPIPQPLPPLASEIPPLEQTASPTPQPSDTPDFDGISASLGDEPQAAPVDSSRFFSRDEFSDQFLIAGLNIGSSLSGLKSLAVDESERPAAREAGGALYDTVLEYPYFHWLISKDTKYLGRFMVISAFFVPKAQAVALELQQRRRPVIQAKAAPAASKDEQAQYIPPTLQ